MRIAHRKFLEVRLLMTTGALFSLAVFGSAAGLWPPCISIALAAAATALPAFLSMRPWRAPQHRRRSARQLSGAAHASAEHGAVPAVPRQNRSTRDTAAPAAGVERLMLVVEDDVISQRLVLRQLGALGYTAHIANNGREALEACAFHAYALVLMDCHMPVMDGFETTRRIRMRDRARARHTPIVALTADPTPGIRARCIAAGMDDCLAKPIQREQLDALLATHLPPPVPRHPAAAAPMFNLPRQRDIFGDDRALRQRMLERFTVDCGPLIARLGGAIAGTNQEEAEAQAQHLARACASVGLDELASLAQAAELAARERNLHDLAQIQRAMMAAFERLCDFISDRKCERA